MAKAKLLWGRCGVAVARFIELVLAKSPMP